MTFPSGLRALALGVAVVCGAEQAEAITFYTTLTGTSGDLPVEVLITTSTEASSSNIIYNDALVQMSSGGEIFKQFIKIGETSYLMSPFDGSQVSSFGLSAPYTRNFKGQQWWQFPSSFAIPEMNLSFTSDEIPLSLTATFDTINVTGSGWFECYSCVLDEAGQVIPRSHGQGSFTVHTASSSLTPPMPTVAAPGPIAGAGLPALLVLGGFVWARRRKAAAAA